jgi:hypothetical protein
MDRRARQKFYASAAWRKMRAWHLAQHPLCVRCQEEDGKLEPATEVDHRIPLAQRPDLALTADNLQSMCTPCHSAKTLAETTGRPVTRNRAKIWGTNADGTPKDPEHAWNRKPGAKPTPPAPAAEPVRAVSKHSPAVGSVYHPAALGADAQHQHAARLLLSGWNEEAVAEMTGLALDQVHTIAEASAGEIPMSTPP